MKNNVCKVIKRKKLFFALPICILIVGIIAGIIFGAAAGSPLNLSADFSGGYKITVKTDEFITANSYEDYKKDINALIDDYSFTYLGEDYGINLINIDFDEGKEVSDRSITIQYKADNSISIFNRDSMMDELNKDFVDKITQIVRYQRPIKVEFSGSTAILTYDTTMYTEVTSGSFKNFIAANGITATNISLLNDDNTKVQFSFSGSHTENEIKMAAVVDRYYSVNVVLSDKYSGTMFVGIISSVVYACLLILLAVLIYAIIRFSVASGFSIILSLFVDIVIVVSLTAIFHIQITTGYLAALVAVMIFSLIAQVSLFDKIKEIRKSVNATGEDASATDVACRAIKQIYKRSIVVALSALILAVTAAVAALIGGVSVVVAIALPLVFGLLSTMFTSLCFAPCAWVTFKRNRLGKLKQFSFGQNKKAAQDVIPTAEESNN